MSSRYSRTVRGILLASEGALWIPPQGDEVAMAYTFRHRFRLRQPGALQIDEPTWLLEQSPHQVRITATRQDSFLQDTEWAALTGDNYASAQEAEEAGRTWRGRLERVFACNRVPADFGDRAGKGYATTASVDEIQKATGDRVLNDEHGLMIYESDPAPQGFIAVGPVSAYVSASRERLEAALATSAAHSATTRREDTAFELYSASFNAEPDARLLSLTMALETLMEQQPRHEATRALVDSFIEQARQADIPDQESLIPALGNLKQESIGHAGKQLAATLDGRTYGEYNPISLFQRAYELRSALTHGHVPRPTRQEVEGVAAPLELLVGHLIAGPELLRELDNA